MHLESSSDNEINIGGHERRHVRDTDPEACAKLQNMPDYFITWFLIFGAITICGALISMSLGMESQPTPLFLAEHKKLYEDWTT